MVSYFHWTDARLTDEKHQKCPKDILWRKSWPKNSDSGDTWLWSGDVFILSSRMAGHSQQLLFLLTVIQNQASSKMQQQFQSSELEIWIIWNVKRFTNCYFCNPQKNKNSILYTFVTYLVPRLQRHTMGILIDTINCKFKVRHWQ